MSRPESTEKRYLSVQQSDQDAEQPVPPHKERKRQFHEKMSLYNIGLLLIGTIAIALALAFLLFVWIGATTAIQRDHAPALWYTILDKDWMLRVVTISSVFLRIAVGLQLGVFAAALAALILERVGASAVDLPTLSMIRCSNTGPLSLFWNVWHSLHSRPQLGYSILVLVAIANTLILQLTSTILLNDLIMTPIVREATARNISFGVKYVAESGGQEADDGGNFWHSAPATYASFAEYSEAGPEGSTFVDTGRTYRGFLPYRLPEDRKNLHNYTGPITIVDSRVVCIKPTLANVSIAGLNFNDRPTLSAVIEWNSTHPAIKNTELDGYKFNCTLPMHVRTQTTLEEEWAAGLCEFGVGSIQLTEGIQTDHDPSLAEATRVHLFLNVTGNGTQWEQAMADTDEMDQAHRYLEQLDSRSAAWATYGHKDVAVDMSLCVINPTPSDYQAQIWSLNSSDTSLGWNSTSETYITEEVRRMLGATSKVLQLDERRIYHLEPVANWTERRTDLVFNTKTQNFVHHALEAFITDEYAYGLGTTHMLTHSLYDNLRSIHRAQLYIVQHILKDTRNPALAFQALCTILMEMAYYDYLPQFDASAPVTSSFKQVFRIPKRWTGLAVVLGLLALHFALVVIAIVLFVTKTEHSLLGDAWQAVMQVVPDDTAVAAHQRPAMTDRHMHDLLQRHGTTSGRVRIGETVFGGQTEGSTLHSRRTDGSKGF